MEDPTEVGDDMIFFEEEKDWEVVATSVVRHDPAAAFTAGEKEAERHGDVPVLRKRAVSLEAVGEREAKRTQSPRPFEVSLALSPPAPGVVEQARRSEEWARTRASSGPVPACDT